MYLLADNGKLISRAEEYVLKRVEEALINEYRCDNVATAAHLDEKTMKVEIVAAVKIKSGEVYRAQREIDATLLGDVDGNERQLKAIGEAVALDVYNAIAQDIASRPPTKPTSPNKPA